MRSLNDSPLGEFVASDIEEGVEEEGSEEEDDDDEEGSEEWDLLERHEASRTEGTFSRSPSKSKLHKSKKPTPTTTSTSRPPLPSTSRSAPPPSAATFSPTLEIPSDAPSFATLKEAFVKKMRSELMAELAGGEDGNGMGEEERRRVEMVVMRSLRGL